MNKSCNVYRCHVGVTSASSALKWTSLEQQKEFGRKVALKLLGEDDGASDSSHGCVGSSILSEVDAASSTPAGPNNPPSLSSLPSTPSTPNSCGTQTSKAKKAGMSGKVSVSGRAWADSPAIGSNSPRAAHLSPNPNPAASKGPAVDGAIALQSTQSGQIGNGQGPRTPRTPPHSGASRARARTSSGDDISMIPIFPSSVVPKRGATLPTAAAAATSPAVASNIGPARELNSISNPGGGGSGDGNSSSSGSVRGGSIYGSCIDSVSNAGGGGGGGGGGNSKSSSSSSSSSGEDGHSQRPSPFAEPGMSFTRRRAESCDLRDFPMSGAISVDSISSNGVGVAAKSPGRGIGGSIGGSISACKVIEEAEVNEESTLEHRVRAKSTSEEKLDFDSVALCAATLPATCLETTTSAAHTKPHVSFAQCDLFASGSGSSSSSGGGSSSNSGTSSGNSSCSKRTSSSSSSSSSPSSVKHIASRAVAPPALSSPATVAIAVAGAVESPMLGVIVQEVNLSLPAVCVLFSSFLVDANT